MMDKFIKKFNLPTGPIEVQETDQICWNNIDWPIYMKCTFNEEIQKLIKIMLNGWRLNKPQIIITIISDFNPLDSWTVDEEIKTQFTNGLGKAMSSAEMWILINGIDVGSSRLMSTIVNNLKCWEKAISSNQEEINDTICIGVVREDRLTSDPIMQRHLKNIQNLSERKPTNTRSGKFFIDDQHSHFIFLKSKKEEMEIEQLFTLELMYQLSFETIWKEKEDDKEDSYIIKHRNFQSSFLNRIPFVSILIQGDQTSSIVVNEYLIKQIPIVVLEGSGGFADLLFFAYNEIRQVIPGDYSDEINDSHFLNKQFSFIFKTKILTIFPELHNKDDEINYLCENLIDCVRYSVQDGIEYLTFLKVSNDENDNQKLSILNKYLLNAYIKSTKVYELDNLLLRHSRINSEEELLNKNLKLTLDWNCPSIAKELIQRKILKGCVKIDRNLFKRAIVEKNREQFIECFMNAGFQCRQLLNLQTIEWFFEQALKKEFFVIICCERILSIQLPTIQSLSFQPYLLTKLNQLIMRIANFKCFFNETSFNYQNQSSNCLENQMITFIIIWSISTLNIEIVRQLWSFHSHPIHVLLMACNILKNLNKFINDLTQNEQIDFYKQELGDLATKLLEDAFIHVRFRAIETLTIKKLHFSNYLACDVAADSFVISFIEHQHTQKWLEDLFTNGICVKQFNGFGFFDHLLPNFFKVFCCFLFVFPINLWLHFSWLLEDEVKKEIEKETNLEFKRLNSKSDDESMNKKIIRSTSFSEKLNNFYDDTTIGFGGRILMELRQLFRFLNPCNQLVIKKWLYLMNSPIAKFWTSLIFFLLFLFVFTYAVIYPSCGSKKLDCIIFIWYSFFVLEDIRITYLILKNYSSINVYYKYFELPFTFAFLIILYLGRIIDYEPVAVNHQYVIKMLMCVVLLQNWLHFVFIYLPISSALGPLFYYLKKMSTHDTFFFIILCMPILIGCGIAIQISLFPDKWFDKDVTRKIFYRTFLNMFLTLDDELRYTDRCYKKLPKDFFSYNIENIFLIGSSGIKPTKNCSQSFTGDKECPNIGFTSFLFAFIFFLLLKLILLNILYAMFSSSLVTYNKQTIWRFQRFNLIMFFNLTSPFPPPFTCIFYIYCIFYQFKLSCLNGGKEFESNRNKYCTLCSDTLNNHFWKRISINLKTKIGDATTSVDSIETIKQQNETLIDQQIKINELNKNLNEIKKVLFQLDYTNENLNEKEIISKLKWITKK